MTDQLKVPILQNEGGDNETKDKDVAKVQDDPDFTKEVQEGREWMGIKDQDIKIVDQLIYRDHPLKNASLNYIFSETSLFCRKKKKVKHQSKINYLRNYELKRFNKDVAGIVKEENDKEEKDQFGNAKKSFSIPDSFHTRYHEQAKNDDEITDEWIQNNIIAENKIEGIDDPYYRFGLGIFTYLSTLRVLLKFMLWMTLISVIQMVLFYGDITEESMKKMAEEKLKPIQYITSYTSLGSYFQAHPKCHRVKLETNNLIMECTGDLKIQQIFEVGIVEHKSDVCTFNGDQFKQLNDTKLVADIEKSAKCNKESFFKIKDMRKLIEQKCLDQQSCSLKGEISKHIKQADSKCQTHVQDLMVQYKCGNDFDKIQERNTTAVICSCLGVLGNLIFIVSISYKLSRYNKIRKLKYAEYTVSSKNFACEVVFNDDHFDYLYINQGEQQITQNTALEDDLNGEPNYHDWYQKDDQQIEEEQQEAERRGREYEQITHDHWSQCLQYPGHWLQDRTVHQVQTELTKFYELDVIKNESRQKWEETKGYGYLKQAIIKFPKDEQNDIIDEIVKNHTEDEDNHQFKVVFCTFAFKNMYLQKELENRGSKICALSTCKTEEINKKMKELKEMNDEILKNIMSDDPKSMKRVDLMTPLSAFITFQNSFAAFLAKKMIKIVKAKKLEKPKIFGQELKISKIGYPTDTQYENYGMNSFEKIMNYFQASIIIFLWGYFYFKGIFTLRQMLENKNDLFLHKEQCDAIIQENSMNPLTFQRSAIDQYKLITVNQEPTQKYKLSFNLIAKEKKLLNSLTGEFSCYCDFYKGKQDITDLSILKLLTDSSQLDLACADYEHLKFWMQFIQLGITLFITVCSAGSQIIIKWIISALSLKKKTDTAGLNSVYQFAMHTFTTLLVPLLMNAKLDFIPVVGKYFKDGKMRDFTWEWYMTLGGVFIQRQLILSLGPLLSALPLGIVKKATQWWFNNGFFKCCLFRKKKSMWEYYKSERGKDFLLEFHAINRLSYVLLLAFMLGPAIPILFVIALIHVVIQECVLRYQLAYHYVKPFNYSNRLNLMLLKFCAALPVIYSSFGLWQYSNRQIFDNTVVPKHRRNGLVDHNHTVVYTLTSLTPGTPLIFLLIVSTFNFVVVMFDLKYTNIFKCSKCKNLNESMSQLRKADTDNFYQYINGDFQFAFFKNYQTYMQKVLKTKSVSPKLYQQFQNDLTKEHDGQLQIYASRMLYEMMIDHNYAMKYDFQFNLIYNTLEKIKHVSDLEQQIKEIIKKKMVQEKKDEGEEGDDTEPKKDKEEGDDAEPKIADDERDKIVYGEHTKTLYLVNLAYMEKTLRHNVTKWFAKPCHIEGGGMIVQDDDQSRAISNDKGRKYNYLFNYEQLVN